MPNRFSICLSERSHAGDGTKTRIFRSFRGRFPSALVGGGGSCAVDRRGTVSVVAAGPLRASTRSVYLRGTFSDAGSAGRAERHETRSLVRSDGHSSSSTHMIWEKTKARAAQHSGRGRPGGGPGRRRSACRCCCLGRRPRVRNSHPGALPMGAGNRASNDWQHDN